MNKICFATWIVFCCALRATAFSPYLDAFNNRYNTATTRLNSCVICHQGSNPNSGPPQSLRNRYGSDFESQPHGSPAANQTALANIESLDSDGDAGNNITEINNRAFPGDPNDPPPDIAPEFHFIQASIQVRENAGSLRIDVVKNGAKAASVDYAVSGGTAEAGRDYMPQAGHLDFGVNEASKGIQITLLDDFVLDGPKELTISLSSPSIGATVGSPGLVSIFITDDEMPLTPALFAHLTPPDTRMAIGRLQIFLEPSSVANGGWRLPWETFWHPSGEIMGNLDVGSYPIQFRPVASYREPATLITPVLNQPQPTVRTVRYQQDPTRPAGSVVVRITPPEVLSSGSTVPGWRLRGDIRFLDNGSRLENVPAGTNHILEFSPVAGWIAPPPRILSVLANLENVVTANYEPVAPVPVGTRLPLPIPTYQEIEDGVSETLRRPLSLMGQLHSSAGYGSGIAVRKKVVLTAAHVLFDESTTNFVSEIEWQHERHAGEYEPRPIQALGWYVFDEYLKQRRKEREQGLAPGVSSPASQEWDVAAIYFDQPVARNGESGFFLSDDPESEWLIGNQDSFLGGYPLSGQADGRLHAVETRKYRFVHESGRLFSTSGFRSYPGNSGGPLCVLAEKDPAGEQTFYPAAVYLGFFDDRSIVRAIDSKVAELINRAASSAELGTNFTGGGVVNFSAAGGEKLGIQRLTVKLQPKEAVDKGAAWRVIVPGGAFVNAGDAATDLVPDFDYTIEFNPVSGWFTPTNFPVSLPAGQDAELTVTYERADPVLAASADGVFVSGPVGKVVEIEFTPVLDTPISWMKVQSISLGAGPILVAGPPWANVPSGYYRLRWQP